MGVTKTNIGLLYWSLNCTNFHIFGSVVCLHKDRIVMSHVPLRAVALCSSIGGRPFATAVINLKKKEKINDTDLR